MGTFNAVTTQNNLKEASREMSTRHKCCEIYRPEFILAKSWIALNGQLSKPVVTIGLYHLSVIDSPILIIMSFVYTELAHSLYLFNSAQLLMNNRRAVCTDRPIRLYEFKCLWPSLFRTIEKRLRLIAFSEDSRHHNQLEVFTRSKDHLLGWLVIFRIDMEEKLVKWRRFFCYYQDLDNEFKWK